MRPEVWRWLRLLVGAAILAVLGLRLGSAPFVAGLLAASPAALAVALVVTAGTTWCCALRWSLVAGRLGAPVSVAQAYVACYRSQLINATLPGGVVGDVHRGARHGWRAVVWERGLGQAVQVALTVLVLLVLPSPFAGLTGLVALAAVVAAVVAGALGRRDLRRLLTPRVAVPVVLLSAVAVAGHLLVLVVAARTSAVQLPLTSLLPVGALVLGGSAVPTNVAGWGPREGVAAWAFAATGAGADAGLTVSVAYGVMSLVATLPGLLVLGRRRPGPTVDELDERDEFDETVVLHG